MSDDAKHHLNAHTWVAYYNDNIPDGAKKPGIVLVCCAEPTYESGTRNYTPLAAHNAKNDAAEVAKSLLKQKWDCSGGGVYVQICLMDDPSTRAEIQASLAGICKPGK